MMHPPAEAPLCDECGESEAAYLDLSCLKCLQLLVRPETTISQIFAVMRQWNPHTQRSIKHCAQMVSQPYFSDDGYYRYTVDRCFNGVSAVLDAGEAQETVVIAGLDRR